MRYDSGKDMDIACLKGSNGWRERIVGLDRKAPLLDGRLVPYINLDNAATTPPLWDVVEAILRFLPYYSSSHRGSGFKSRISTAAYDEAHEIIGRFVGAEMDSNTVIFGKNTTDDRERSVERHGLRPADSPPGAKGSRRRSQDSRGRGSVGASLPNRRQTR